MFSLSFFDMGDAKKMGDNQFVDLVYRLGNDVISKSGSVKLESRPVNVEKAEVKTFDDNDEWDNYMKVYIS